VTAVPQPLGHLLTVGEYAALGEGEHGRCELVEGNLLMAPSPTPDHMIALGRLYRQLAQQAPDGLEVIPDVDIDLELVPPEEPGFSRRPDLLVVRRAAVRRVRSEGGLLRASEALLAVEIVSPGSRRTDNVVKRGEYADAGIPRYWIVDIDEPVSLVACHLAEEFGYAGDGAATGEFTAGQPFPLHLDLDQLR
jgi:Uma2 family endonuclease